MKALIDFLTARYLEDQQIAEAASPAPWAAENNGSITHAGPSRSKSKDGQALGMKVIASVGAYDLGLPSSADAAHITRWDPTRALAELAVKRRFLEHSRHCLDDREDFPDDHGYRLAAITASWFLRLLAHPYASHPDYQPRWSLDGTAWDPNAAPEVTP